MATSLLSVEQIARLLESTCTLLEGEINALDDADARWHPAEGEWCVNEVLGHLIEAEKRGFAGRIERILEEDRPREPGWDQAAVARARQDCDRVALSLFMEWMGLRHRSVQMVRALQPDQLDRACVHAKVGELRVRDLLHEWVHHDRNHTRQLLANVQARVWPHMGNTQLFQGE
ncbi:MAG: DinB family protein [Chloroflexota bacterium]|nr:DinB family protein [Chloroflexota bacterium]MDE3192689.1 DinB family protein [Chloroflexota bacterium]